MLRRLPAPPALLLYALVFLAECLWHVMVPLAPAYRSDLSLSTFQTGVAVAASSVAVVLLSVPAGLAADRYGARRPTVIATAVLAAGALAQGVATSYPALLAARFLVGIGLAVAWTSGMEWLARLSSEERRASAVGAIMAVAGVASVVGPGAGGLAADRFGLHAPFLVAGVVTITMVVALALGVPAVEAQHEPSSLPRAVRLARREALVLGSVAVMLLTASVTAAVNLLVPLALRSHGLSTGAIGVVFAGSAMLFITVSAVVARGGGSLATLPVAGVATIVLGAALVVLIASEAEPALVGFLALRTPCAAVLFTIAYPLGMRGAERAGVPRAPVVGLLNLVWGLAMMVGPLAAAALAAVSGDQVVYALLAVSCAATGTWLLRRPPLAGSVDARLVRP